MKILVTEDDPMTRKVIEKALTTAGMEVVTSENGNDALNILSSQSFDVILIDIHMPVFNGIELIKKIRDDLCINTPIAIVTREKSETMVRDAFEAGADDYISKPFEKDYLLKRIEKISAKNTGRSLLK